MPVADVNEILGVNTVKQLEEAEKIMSERLREETEEQS